MKKWKPLLAACALAAGLAGHSMAQIVVGQTVGVTGSAAITVKESMQGASLYLDFVNAQGGVGGQKIELVVLDDKFDTKLTLENARTLIEKHGAIALFMTRGTPHTQGILPLLDEAGLIAGAKAAHLWQRDQFVAQHPAGRPVDELFATAYRESLQ